MAKHNTEKQEEDLIVDVGGSLNKAEQFVETYQKQITYVAIAILAIVGGYFGYNNMYLAPLEVEAKSEIWRAQQYFENDSLDLAIYGDGNYLGFEALADEYGMTKSGNLANYYLGICYMKKGQFELAIDYLSQFSGNDIMVSSVASGTIGDAYLELGDVDKALSQYLKASNSTPNEYTSPIYLMKAGMAYEMLNDFDGAKGVYQSIKEKYPETQEGRNIDKYIARASKS